MSIHLKEIDMTSKDHVDKAHDPQLQQSKPPAVDEVARQQQKSEAKEIAGRHKNDGQNDHQANQRRPDSDRSKA